MHQSTARYIDLSHLVSDDDAVTWKNVAGILDGQYILASLSGYSQVPGLNEDARRRVTRLTEAYPTDLVIKYLDVDRRQLWVHVAVESAVRCCIGYPLQDICSNVTTPEESLTAARKAVSQEPSVIDLKMIDRQIHSVVDIKEQLKTLDVSGSVFLSIVAEIFRVEVVLLMMEVSVAAELAARSSVGWNSALLRLSWH